jgi:hypothetical protein
VIGRSLYVPLRDTSVTASNGKHFGWLAVLAVNILSSFEKRLAIAKQAKL